MFIINNTLLFGIKNFGKSLGKVGERLSKFKKENMWLIFLILIALSFILCKCGKEIGMPVDFFSQDETAKKEAPQTDDSTEKESGETSKEKGEGPVYNTPQETPFYKDMIAGEDLSDPLVKRLVKKASTLSFYEWQESKKREKVLLKVIEMIVDSIKQAGLEAELKHNSKSRV